MADFNNLALTATGIKALLSAQAGKTLKLTKIGMGSGATTESILNLTNMVTPEVMIPISEKKINDESGYLAIVAKMTNNDISEGFYWRETGLFFEDESGNDVLFAYACVVDDQYDYVPAYSDKRYVKHVRIANILTDSANITIKENEGLLYVDILTFEEFKEEVEALEEKVDGLASKFLDRKLEVYVSNSGSDDNGDGSQKNPWKTIQHAVSQCPSVPIGTYGYFVYLAPGVYDEIVDFRDKSLYFTIQGGSSLEDADEYVIKGLKSYRVTSLNIKSVKFTGVDLNGTSKWGINFGSGHIHLQNCKFDDCILDVESNGAGLLTTCDFSNYRSGTGSYGTIRVSGGRIYCNGVTGSNNKSGYGAGAGAKNGGDIYVNNDCTLTADRLIIESNRGKVHTISSDPVNNNLLINSNFANPVNQRGWSSSPTGSSNYCIDRWKKYHNVSVAIDNDCIKITRGSGTSNISLVQTVEERLLGKTVTLSVKLNGVNETVSVTALIPKNYNTSEDTMIAETSYINNVRASIYQRTDGLVRVQIIPAANSTIKVEWAKLEIGNVATPYVPRLYAEEFILCQRYYQLLPMLDANLYVWEKSFFQLTQSFKTEMRIDPTVNFDAIAVIRNGNIESGYNISLINISKYHVILKVTKENHGITFENPIALSGRVALDAEL